MLIIGISACKQANKEELEQVKEQIAYDETSKVLDERSGDLFETVHVSELGAILHAMNAQYDESFVNDPGRTGEYLDVPAQAAASLGIYYMDIHYVAACDKKDKVAAIYNAMQTSRQVLKISRLFL